MSFPFDRELQPHIGGLAITRSTPAAVGYLTSQVGQSIASVVYIVEGGRVMPRAATVITL